MIDSNRIMLLAQLIDSLSEQSAQFEKSLAANDKKRFDNAKAGILEIQAQINALLNEK